MKQSIFLFAILFSVSLAQGQQCRNDYLLPFEEIDSAGVTRNGFRTASGEIAIPAKYRDVYIDTMYHMAIVMTFDWKMQCIDRNDSILCVPFIFDNGPDYVSEGLFRIVENGKMGFANTNGEVVIPATFDFVSPFGEGEEEYREEGIAAYVMGGCRCYCDDEHWTWAGGYESGYINHSGQRFSKVEKLKNGKRKVWTSDGKQLMLDRQGNIL